MKKSEIEKRYNKLLHEVATNEYYTKVDLTNRVNSYVCPEGHISKTRDVDSGVTPMFIKCESCQHQAASRFYKDVNPIQDVTQEFYRPSLRQLLKMSTREWNDGMIEHVLSGGLMIRKIVK